MSVMTRAHARRTDPATSHEAADRATKKLSELEHAVMTLLWRHGPINHEELVELYNRSDYPPRKASGIRSRCHDLVTKGKVRQAEDRRPQRDGTMVCAWEVDI